MKMPASITIGEILSIIERSHPESLLLLRKDSGLDDDTMQELWRKLVSSFDPKRRLATIEYLLLIMHEARAKDPQRYLHEIFLPWAGIKRRLYNQVMRILDDISRMKDIEAYTDDDAAHICTKIYRPLVADIFDPFMTLLVATYQFIDGNFASIEDANLGSGERNKAELVNARIKKFGGPIDLLSGYDPVVRNAVSHAGSDGVLFEPGSVLFRNIKRGIPPTVETRRWTHDELHMHVIELLELIMSIDAGFDIFGIDCMDLLTERETLHHALFHAFDKSHRAKIRQSTEDKLQQIRTTDKLTTEQRFDLLAKILFQQCAERAMPCSGVRLNQEEKALLVDVPVDSAPVSESEIRDQAIKLVRYAILARAVFGTLFDRFLVEGLVNDTQAMMIELLGAVLDEYATETAGLIDLITDAKIWVDGGTVKILMDEAALAAAEDASLGPRLPRRGRPVFD